MSHRVTLVLLQHLHRARRTVLAVLATLAVGVCAASDFDPYHAIASLSARAGAAPELTLKGSVPSPLQKFFDLFPLEVSGDLVGWQPLATVLRTNVTNVVNFADTGFGQAEARFYRVPTNLFSTPFPAPKGPFAVGVVHRQITDPTRTNRLGIRTNSAFMLTLWYPAERTTGHSPAAYTPLALATNRNYWASWTNVVPAFHSHAQGSAPIAASDGGFPVVIYSHGLGDALGVASRTENTQAAVELASHGYVVVSMDHSETYATVLESGQVLFGRRVGSFDYMADRKKDVAWMLDRIAAWQVEDPLLQGRLDTDRVGIMGWSFGGGTAAETGRLEGRLKAVVLLDGYLGSSPGVSSGGLQKPFLSMNSGELIDENTTLFNRATKDAYLLTIRNSVHNRFTDDAWTVTATEAKRQQATAMNACTVAFFEKYLRGVDTQFFVAPSNAFPEIVSFRRK